MNRTHAILAALLFVQLALLALLRSPFAGSAASEPHPLLPGLSDSEPARIEISEGEGKSVTLVRGQDGWTVADADDYPADAGAVAELIDKLAGLEVRHPVVTSARYHDALGVGGDKHEGRVRIWTDEGDDPRFDLLVGTSPNYRVTHVRPAAEDAVYEVRGLGRYDLRPDAEAWILKRFVDVPAEQIHSIELTNPHGTLKLERGEQGFVLVAPAGRDVHLDPDKVDGWVRSLGQFWISEPGGRLDEAAQGLARPFATVEIGYAEDDEQRAVTVRIGGEVPDEEGKRYAARSGFDRVAILDSYEAAKITDKKLADLTAD